MSESEKLTYAIKKLKQVREICYNSDSDNLIKTVIACIKVTEGAIYDIEIPATGNVQRADRPHTRTETQSTSAAWTDREVAKFLGVSLGTVRRWRLTKGGPPYFRIGSSIRYDPAKCEEWRQSHQAGGAQ